jgi:hypothetical protein
MKRLALAAVIGLAGCGPYWVEAGHYSAGTASVDLPGGWVRPREAAELDATRDGYGLQSIELHRQPFGTPFGATKKTVTKTMLAEEAAEVVRDELATAYAAQSFELVDDAPANLSGTPGFKLVVRRRTPDGLRIKELIYGAAGGDGLYLFRYAAPERYYFDRDLPAFERARETLRLR